MLASRTYQHRGIIVDLPADEAPDDFWSYGRNIFFRDRSTQRVPGYAPYYGAVAGKRPVFIYSVLRRAAPLWIIVLQTGADPGPYGTEVIRWDGSTAITLHTDAALDAAAQVWSATDLNGRIFLNAAFVTGWPRVWNEVTNAFDALPDWPADTTCRVLRSYKYHLFALAPKTPTVESDYEYLWSDAAEPGAIPQSWTAQPATDAGNDQLSRPQGFLVDAIALGQGGGFLIMKDFSSHIVQFVGGVFVYATRDQHLAAGCLTTGCAVELSDGAIIATQDDVIYTDGQAIRSLCSHQVRRYIFGRINPDQLQWAQLTRRQNFDEIWFSYPTGQEPYCTEAAVYNTRTRRWGFRPLPNVSSLGHGLVTDPDAKLTWGSRTHPWGEDATRWGERGFSNFNDHILFARPRLGDNSEGKVYIDGVGFSADGEDIDAEVRREGLLLDGDPRTVKYVNEVWPHIYGREGDVVNISVGGAFDEDGPVRWCPAQPYRIGQEQVKVNTHCVGRYIAVRVTSSGGAPWRLHNYRLTYAVNGGW